MAVTLNLATLRPKAGLNSTEVDRWNDTESCLREAQKEIRTFSYLIHPPTLEADRLVVTLKQFITGFCDRTGLVVKLRLNPELDELPFQMQRTLLRIVQEALTNVLRHAVASVVRLEGRIVAGRVHLIVADNGRGLQCGQEATSGRGIRGMQDRTHRWGGMLRLRSASKGTTVHAVWPVGQHAGITSLRKVLPHPSGTKPPVEG